MARASLSLSIVMRIGLRALAELALGVDHVHAVEARRRAAVRHRADLAGLALAVEERTVHAVVALVGDLHARVPELLGVRLVGDVAELLRDLAVLDLVEQLAPELEVVALL